MLSRMLTRSQMALLCLGLFLALALCGAWQACAWGRTQLDTGALVCADTLRRHIRAESDSSASQSAKLHVRDAVLAYLDTACPAPVSYTHLVRPCSRLSMPASRTAHGVLKSGSPTPRLMPVSYTHLERNAPRRPAARRAVWAGSAGSGSDIPG